MDALADKSFDVVHFYKENHQEFNEFNRLIEELPTQNTLVGVISIETGTLRSQLLSVPKKLVDALKGRLLDLVTKDARELRTELFAHHSLLEQSAPTLPHFVQQLTATRQLKSQHLHCCQRRLEFVLDCVHLCKREALRIPANISSTIDECKSLVKHLPITIEQAESRFSENRKRFEEQVQRDSERLSMKIRTFELKFVERYLRDPGKYQRTAEVRKELEKREEALVVMKHRVELQQAFEKALRPHSAQTYTLQCRNDFARAFALYCDTLKLWKLAAHWQDSLETWLNVPFAQLNVLKMCRKIGEICKRLGPGYFESDLFVHTADTVLKVFKEEISDLDSICGVLKDLKSAALKPKHWELILKYLAKPHCINTEFRLQDLKDAKLLRHEKRIREVLAEAEEESVNEAALLRIKQE